MVVLRLTAKATLLLLILATIVFKFCATATAGISAPYAAKEEAPADSKVPRVSRSMPGHIVVVDGGNDRVQVLRYSDGAHVRTIGSECSGNGQFFLPCGGIAIDSDGRIVVADTNNSRVQILN